MSAFDTLVSTSIFTSVLDVDKLILLALNEKTLFRITQVSKTIRNIILKELPLRKKFVNYKLLYVKVIKMIKNITYYSNQVDVRITSLNKLSIQDIVALLPTIENIKLKDYAITYTIHANQMIDSIEQIVVKLNGLFDLGQISLQYGCRFEYDC